MKTKWVQHEINLKYGVPQGLILTLFMLKVGDDVFGRQHICCILLSPDNPETHLVTFLSSWWWWSYILILVGPLVAHEVLKPKVFMQWAEGHRWWLWIDQIRRISSFDRRVCLWQQAGGHHWLDQHPPGQPGQPVGCSIFPVLKVAVALLMFALKLPEEVLYHKLSMEDVSGSLRC